MSLIPSLARDCCKVPIATAIDAPLGCHTQALIIVFAHLVLPSTSNVMGVGGLILLAISDLLWSPVSVDGTLMLVEVTPSVGKGSSCLFELDSYFVPSSMMPPCVCSILGNQTLMRFYSL